MKNHFLYFIILINIVVGSTIENYAHKQRTHQYIVREAYTLLTQFLGRPIPIMQTALGYNQDGGFVSHWPGDNGHPWIEGKIVAGAFREDEEDVMYGYGDGIGDITRYIWASVTHFWNADGGDEYLSYLTAPVAGTYPNALMKLRKYANGGWEINNYLALVWGLPNGNGVPCATQWANLHLTYNSLADMYQNKKIYVTAVEFFGSGTVYYNPPRLLTNDNLQNISVEYLVDMFTWEILGRMCHLLADMSVPAHAHCDSHGTDPDPYEDAMNYEVYPSFVTFWNATNVWSTFANIMDPLNQPDPLRYLMYDQNQYSDHFGSRDFSGDDVISPPFYIIPYYPYNIQPTNSTGATLTETEKINIRDGTFPHVIRATAGLLYWFANEVDIIPPPPPPLHVTINGNTHPPSYSTTDFTSTVTGAQGGVTYQWEQMLQCCTDDYSCGVYFYRGSNSTLSIYNTTIHYYLRLTVWDGAGRSAVDYHYVTLETCVPGGGNGCPTLAFEPDSTSDSGGEDENTLLITSTTYPTEDVVDYYLIQSEIAPINGDIHFNIHEPASEHTWLDQVQLIEIETNQDELVAVTENGEIVNYLESDSDLTIMLNDTIDVTTVLESSDGNTLNVVPGDILSIAIDPNSTEVDDNVVAIDGFVSQKIIAADVLFIFPGGEDEDVGDFFLRPNASISALNFGGLGAGTLKLVFYQEGTLDFLSLLYDLNTAEIETLEITAAVHSESGSVLGQVDGKPDQQYAEIYPDQDISFTFTEGEHSLSSIRYVLKTVGRYETDTTDAFNKLANSTEEIIIPKENKLYDNYPNPFNPTTQIKFAVKENGLVILKVYDVLGKEVVELVNEQKHAGNYTVNFDGSNLSSGIYFYTISAKDFLQTKKMILIK